MLKKIQDAVPARNEHIVALQDLESGLPPEKVAAWTIAVDLWESDSSQPNPFESTTKSMSCFGYSYYYTDWRHSDI